MSQKTRRYHGPLTSHRLNSPPPSPIQMTWTCGSWSRERSCGRSPKFSGKTAERRIALPPPWKIHRLPAPVFASSVPSTSAPESPSNGIASSFRPLRKIAAPMVEIFCWEYAARLTETARSRDCLPIPGRHRPGPTPSETARRSHKRCSASIGNPEAEHRCATRDPPAQRSCSSAENCGSTFRRRR